MNADIIKLNVKNVVLILYVVVLLLYGSECLAKKNHELKDQTLKRVFDYGSRVGRIIGDTTLNMLVEYRMNVERRNFTMCLIPSMYSVAHGNRRYSGQTLSKVHVSGGKVQDIDIQSIRGTLPDNREAVSILRLFVIPRIYDEAIFGNFLLSPLNAANTRLYEYESTRLTDGRVEIVFIPRFKNTQLISGHAIVDESSGRALKIMFNGILDMIRFELELSMDKVSALPPQIPQSSRLNAEFSFMGNKVRVDNRICYGGVTLGADSLPAARETLGLENEDSALTVGKPATGCSGGNRMLKSAGDFFIDRIKGNFGSRNQGYYRISPIVNPLYLGYSNRKGVTYRMKFNLGYKFTERQNLSMSLNLGYSFKQDQVYMSVPVKFVVGSRVYVESEFGSGNRITSSEILDQIKHESYDSIHWEDMNLNYFKNLYWRLRACVRLSERLSVRPGVSYHRRSAVDREAFAASGKRRVYYSFAPTLSLQYKPWKDDGPVFTVDYERGIKGVAKSATDYERIETDASWKRHLTGMRCLSVRSGYGVYTSRSKGSYFLDFVNFRYENLPGGWDDDWTGEFQLLNSNWYNASSYYLRNNLTYECPMLLMSRLPFVGRYLEMERVYANMLFTDHLHPYVEYGYGFTNRLFSMGVFCGTSYRKFEGVGVRFGLELFRDW